MDSRICSEGIRFLEASPGRSRALAPSAPDRRYDAHRSSLRVSPSRAVSIRLAATRGAGLRPPGERSTSRLECARLRPRGTALLTVLERSRGRRVTPPGVIRRRTPVVRHLLCLHQEHLGRDGDFPCCARKAGYGLAAASCDVAVWRLSQHHSRDWGSTPPRLAG
jgi:hypothetical protein